VLLPDAPVVLGDFCSPVLWLEELFELVCDCADTDKLITVNKDAIISFFIFINLVAVASFPLALPN
jgi:hypothetical protein